MHSNHLTGCCAGWMALWHCFPVHGRHSLCCIISSMYTSFFHYAWRQCAAPSEWLTCFERTGAWTILALCGLRVENVGSWAWMYAHIMIASCLHAWEMVMRKCMHVRQSCAFNSLPMHADYIRWTVPYSCSSALVSSKTLPFSHVQAHATCML